MRLHTTVLAGVAALLLGVTTSVAAAGGANAVTDHKQRICIVYGMPNGPAVHGGTEVATTGTVCYRGVAAYVSGVTKGHASVAVSASLHQANRKINQYTGQQSGTASPSAAPDGTDSSTVVGCGCDGSNFTSTCWNFAVGGSCSRGTSWHWGTLVMDNRLSSWSAEANCSHGILYDLPYEASGSVKITCYTCYSLGNMDNRASSLGVYP